MTEIKGTPITRGGGYLIRVGWRAVGYSVDKATESRYRMMKAVLLLIAILVGIGAVFLAEYVLFDIVDPIIEGRTKLIRSHPELWRLLIYVLTVFFGGLIYLQITASVGNHMVKGASKRDDGLSFIEQRRRIAFSRKREFLVGILAVAAIWLAPVDFNMALKATVSLLIAARLFEGLYLKVVR